MYTIEFTQEAIEDLKAFRKFEQKRILDAIESQLRHEPNVKTRNRFPMRPNLVAEWELRVGRYRVFYNVEEQERIVIVEAIGFKIGSQLFVRGRRRTL